jgi:hypothetical protein
MAQTRSRVAVGWTFFASLMMVMLGAWWVVAGFAEVLKDNVFVLTPEYVFKFNVTTWGWIHLMLGILVALAGLALFQGAVWARTVGVILAVVSGLIGFAWLPWYPVWGIIFITASVFVIWALTVHGSDITADPN